MSNLISVPRELLERALTILALSPSGLYGELRNLLAKPAANTDVRTILLDVVPGDGDGREVYATCCDDIVTMLSDQADRIEELEAAQPQGAPVAWRVTGNGGLTVTPEYPKWALGERGLTITPLYTEQPAPVAVVLPDVCTLSNIIRKVDGNHSLGAGALAEAIIDEVARLNTK